MKMPSVPRLLIFVCLTGALGASPVYAQPSCEWFPSSDCAAQVSAGSTSQPCFSGQVKADWLSMSYHLPWQASYRSTGTGSNADVWCFDSEQQAIYYGFRRAER
jgi:hypothetical protein